MTHYQIRDDQLHVYLSGTVEAARLRELFVEIGQDPAFNCHMTQFWHTSAANCSNLETHALVELARDSAEQSQSTVPVIAFIAQSDLNYGLCRVYSAWVDEAAAEIGVFRTLDEASNWTCAPISDRQAG